MALVKIFASDTTDSLENDINDFLAEEGYAEIIDIKLSTAATSVHNDQYGTSDALALYSALVLYREK